MRPREVQSSRSMEAKRRVAPGGSLDGPVCPQSHGKGLVRWRDEVCLKRPQRQFSHLWSDRAKLSKVPLPRKMLQSYTIRRGGSKCLGSYPRFPTVTTNSSRCSLSLGRKYGHMCEMDLLPEKGVLIQLQVFSAATQGSKFQLAGSSSDTA